jgi:hypothetical protein
MAIGDQFATRAKKRQTEAVALSPSDHDAADKYAGLVSLAATLAQ